MECQKLFLKYCEADKVLEQAYQLDAAGKQKEANQIILKAKRDFPDRLALFAVASMWDKDLLSTFKLPSVALSYKAAALDPDPAAGLIRKAQTYKRRYMQANSISESTIHESKTEISKTESNPKLAAEFQKAVSLSKAVLQLPAKPETVAEACEIIRMNSSKDGISAATKAIAMYPGDSRFYSQRAKCYSDLLETDLAAKDTKTAAKLKATALNRNEH